MPLTNESHNEKELKTASLLQMERKYSACGARTITLKEML